VVAGAAASAKGSEQCIHVGDGFAFGVDGNRFDPRPRPIMRVTQRLSSHAVGFLASEIALPDGTSYKFDVDAHRKHCLLNGLDDIGLTLEHVGDIKAFEEKHKAAQPWLYA